jgi:hypothetical protein
MASHVVWLVSREFPRRYSFTTTTTTYGNIWLYELKNSNFLSFIWLSSGLSDLWVFTEICLRQVI